MSEAIKVTELIKSKEKIPFGYSIELVPTVTVNELDSLSPKPAFISITWHASQHECKGLDIAPLNLASELRSKGYNVLMHLTCELLKKEFVNSLLTFLQENGVCNLLVMLGEGYDHFKSDFKNAKDLIKYIKNQKQDYFCIGVVGFLDCSDDKLENIKDKIDAGAEFMLTQAFFEPNQYAEFVKRCKNAGIEAPVIPGIFLFDTKNELTNFCNRCAVKVSKKLVDSVAGKESKGKEVRQMLISNISASGMKHFHFFTLNKLDKVGNFIREAK